MLSAGIYLVLIFPPPMCFRFTNCVFILWQRFSTAGPRPSTGPWQQLHRAARDSPGIDNKFKCNVIFVNMPHRTHKCANTLYDYVIINYNEELNDLYSSPNIVRVIKSRRMRWAGHVARMGEERGVSALGGETGGKETTGET